MMTTPTVTPSTWKTWIGLAGAALTALIPYFLSVSTSLPEPWPAVVGGVVALLTAVGIYKAPYKPEGTVLVADPNPPLPPAARGGGDYRNPWRA